MKVVRFVGTGLGLALMAASQWVERDASDGTSTLWEVMFWSGLIITVASALAIEFLDERVPDVIGENVRLSKDLDEQNEFFLYMDGYIDSLLARTSLTQVLRELLEVAVLDDKWADVDVARYCKSICEFLAERRVALFGIEDEYWSFAIYKFEPGSGRLECIANKRAKDDDTATKHRTWAPGEGHVGLAYLRNNELIFADSTTKELEPVIMAKGENFRDYDRDRYVSLASIPISSDGKSPLGILIATSDKAGRFKTIDEQDDDEWERVDALRDVAAFLAILMRSAHTRYGNGGSNDNKQSHDGGGGDGKEV